MGVILLVLNSALVFAQTTTLANPVEDTVKAKWGKVKIVDGDANDFVK